MLVGEAPGAWEQRSGIPFSGPSGRLLQEWWSKVGLKRTDFFIDNVYRFRPPNNNLSRIPRADVERGAEKLRGTVGKLPNLRIIVPAGNYALRAVLGQPLWGRDGYRISDWRGSVIPHPTLPGVLVVPTKHPAETFRRPQDVLLCVADWGKIARILKNDYTPPSPANHIIRPTRDIVARYLHTAHTEPGRPLVIDIETDPVERRIICVGFAFSGAESLTLDFARWRDAIARLCESDNPKVLQNGLYDVTWLHANGIRVRGYRWDTLAMHHCLRPHLPHDLATQISLYTDHPYHKHSAKDAETIKAERTPYHALARYNGKDCTTTFELYQRHLRELEEAGRLGVYDRLYRAMLRPLSALMTHGVRVDVERLRLRGEEVRREARRLAARIERLTGANICRCGHRGKAHLQKHIDLNAGLLRKDGKPRAPRWRVCNPCTECTCSDFAPERSGLIGRTNLSSQKVAAHLYDHLGLPEQRAVRATGNRTRTVNELACVHLIRTVERWAAIPAAARRRARTPWKRKPRRTIALLKAILEHKRVSKLATFCRVDHLVDSDGRMRCTYKFTTITGRLASSRNPLGRGSNLQNVDRAVRDCFVPDQEGWVFVEADYSQGETRLLYAMTGEEELVRLAAAPPSEVDIYVENAARMFGVPPSKVTKEQRRDAKQTTLACGYGMGARRMAELAALAGLHKSEEECEQFLRSYLAQRPGVSRYQTWIRARIIRERRLTTCWGRELDLRWRRLDREVHKHGYAFLPQSTLGDALNQRGLIPLDRYIRRHRLQSRINLQVHDALVVSCPPTEAWRVARRLVRELTRPIDIPTVDGRTIQLSIPVGLKVGLNWAFDPGREFEKLPSREEFETCLHELTKTAS